MSNGDSLDGFVFPPFIPTASRQPQAPPPQPAAQEPAPAPAAEAAGRMTMPWDLETPIVRDADTAQPPAAADEDEDLPWLEVPAPRGDEAAAPSAPAAGEEFPAWMAWDQRDETAAEADARDSVAPIAGIEDFIPADELGGGFVAPPAIEWAEADPAADAAAPADSFESMFDAPAPPADAAPSAEAPAQDDPFEALFNPPAEPASSAFEAPAAESAFPAFDAPAAEPEPFAEGSFDAPAAESAAPSFDAPVSEFAAPAFDAPAAAPEQDAWSLGTPEAAEPPPADAPAATWEESPAAAAPSYEVSVDESDALTIEPAAAESSATGAPVADEAAMEEPASVPQPFVADEEAVIASEPDPFTAASVAEAEAATPAEPAQAGSAFDDVAARLESIARMLRERPDELLAGGSPDPLA
ncbi:MAG TPA: hypothetical protein VFZ20_28820, partial [Longimicrobium sp.]|nr:hypothetical protein [Longimicrobium sp.]